MSEIAIVLLNWNGQTLLEKFLPTVIKYSENENTEIIVTDNASTDNSIAYLQKEFPNTRLILLDKNYGFAEGYNQALRQVKAKYYVLLNTDVEVTENWVTSIIDEMEKDEMIVAAQPKINAFNNKIFFEHAGAVGGFIDRWGFPFCRGRIFDAVEKDTGQYDKMKEIFWATGTAFFVRAKAFHEAGGFDNDFFAHMEEIDLCWRMKNRGYKIWCYPQSVVYHIGGASLPYESPFKLYLNFRNNLFMMYKNLSPQNFFFILLWRLFLDSVAGLSFLFKLKFSQFLAIIKAHLAFFKSIGKLRKKRKILLPKQKQSIHPEIYNKSIIWDYFVKKKQKFSELSV